MNGNNLCGACGGTVALGSSQCNSCQSPVASIAPEAPPAGAAWVVRVVRRHPVETRAVGAAVLLLLGFLAWRASVRAEWREQEQRERSARYAEENRRFVNEYVRREAEEKARQEVEGAAAAERSRTFGAKGEREAERVRQLEDSPARRKARLLRAIAAVEREAGSYSFRLVENLPNAVAVEVRSHHSAQDIVMLLDDMAWAFGEAGVEITVFGTMKGRVVGYAGPAQGSWSRIEQGSEGGVVMR